MGWWLEICRVKLISTQVVVGVEVGKSKKGWVLFRFLENFLVRNDVKIRETVRVTLVGFQNENKLQF